MDEEEYRPPATIQEAFEDFDRAHPEVNNYLVALAFQLYYDGWVHYGIGALWERMRWHFRIDQKLGEDFKLNNNYRSRYARKIMAEHPLLDGFFELRELKAA